MIDLIERGELSVGQVEVLVVDEADRMADMGFMPQVQKILYRIKSEHQTMLFSATLDGAVKRLVDRYMNDPVSHEVDDAEPTVDEMEHVFLAVHQMDKVKVAASIARGANRTLVFVRTKRGADRLVTQLRREERAGRRDPRRPPSGRAGAGAGRLHRRQGAACSSPPTSPRAGIHVDGVDVVVHYDPPEDEKAYLHRSGRTARAGESGVAVTLMLWNQENEVRVIQRRLGLQIPVVEVFSNDPRLLDLANWSVGDVAVSA